MVLLSCWSLIKTNQYIIVNNDLTLKPRFWSLWWNQQRSRRPDRHLWSHGGQTSTMAYWVSSRVQPGTATTRQWSNRVHCQLDDTGGIVNGQAPFLPATSDVLVSCLSEDFHGSCGVTKSCWRPAGFSCQVAWLLLLSTPVQNLLFWISST